MKRCCVARLTPGKGAALSASLPRAEIRPLGLRVNCTDVASARYSRWRDTAICTALAASGAKIATTISRMMSNPPPEPFLSLLLLLLPDPPQAMVRSSMSQTRAIRPTVTPTITM